MPGQDPGDAREVIAELVERTPEIACIAVTRRAAHSASRNDWSALGWSRATGVAETSQRGELEIFDRVGGGDGFAAGFLYGLLGKAELTAAVNYGTAHGALVMTTPDDRSSAWLPEVRDLAEAGTHGFLR